MAVISISFCWLIGLALSRNGSTGLAALLESVEVCPVNVLCQLALHSPGFPAIQPSWPILSRDLSTCLSDRSGASSLKPGPALPQRSQSKEQPGCSWASVHSRKRPPGQDGAQGKAVRAPVFLRLSWRVMKKRRELRPKVLSTVSMWRFADTWCIVKHPWNTSLLLFLLHILMVVAFSHF